MEQQHSRLGRWALIIGIVIVFTMFCNYAISLVYPAPEYDKYVIRTQVVKTYNNEADCLSVGGQWNENQNVPQEVVQPGTQKETGYCDAEYSIRLQYEEANKQYERTVFAILVVIGAALLIVGVSLSHIVLAPAFAGAGILSLLIASFRYWSFAGDGLRVVLLALALAGLLWVAVKKFGHTV